MLQKESEEELDAFYRAAYADGEVDDRTKILIGMAVAMGVACHP